MDHAKRAQGAARIFLEVNTAAYLIKKLRLERHPEGGYYREAYRSPEAIYQKALPRRYDGPRVFSASIFYLLRSDEVSYFHRLRSDEIWHFYRGSRLSVFVLSPAGKVSRIRLGRNSKAGEIFQALVPAGHWFGAAVGRPNSYSLVGCTVAPGFDFLDFELGRRDELLALYPRHRAIINKLTMPPQGPVLDKESSHLLSMKKKLSGI
jgi:predicted cupin superfamily sugar epimerase